MTPKQKRQQTFHRQTIDAMRLSDRGSHGSIHDRMRAKYRLDAVRLAEQWERLADAGLVCLQVFPDEFCSFDDLAGGFFNPDRSINTPGGLRALTAQRKVFERQIESDGVWGCCSFYRTKPYDPDGNGILSVNNPIHDVDYYASRFHPKGMTQAEHDGWILADSCWRFVGNEWQDSGYDTNAMWSAIDGLRDTLRKRDRVTGRCPTCQSELHRSASLSA